MSPFKEYSLMCPKCGSKRIQGEGARHEGFMYSCRDCGFEAFSRTTFKKERVLQMKRWRNKETTIK